MRGSPSVFAFPMILAAHTIGLVLLAGIDIAHTLRVLGAAAVVLVKMIRRPGRRAPKTLAGVNILVFYALFFRRVRRLEAGAGAPAALKAIGSVSLVCWATVIICGRLITFFRPAGCLPGEPIGLIATGIVR